MTQDKQLVEAVKQLLNVFTAFATFGKTRESWFRIEVHFQSPDGSLAHELTLDNPNGLIEVNRSNRQYAIYRTLAFQEFCRSLGVELEKHGV